MGGGLAETPGGTSQWSTLMTACFRQRIRADQLTEAFKEQWGKARIPGTVLVLLVLTSSARVASGVDPLIPAYVNEILKVTSVDICDVLIALLSHSQYAIKDPSAHVGPKHTSPDSLLQETVFALLLRLLVNGERPRTVQESRRAVRAIAEWMTACNYHETMLQVQSEGLRTPETSVTSALETLGTFATSLLTTEMARTDIQKSWSQG